MLPQLLNAKLSVEKAMITDPFAKLPLFATDDEIAIAIVGKSRASDWKRGSLRVLEDRGFPLIDPCMVVVRFPSSRSGTTCIWASTGAMSNERRKMGRKIWRHFGVKWTSAMNANPSLGSTGAARRLSCLWWPIPTHRPPSPSPTLALQHGASGRKGRRRGRE